MPVELVLVTASDEVRQSLARFNSEAKQFRDRALSLLHQTTYWVYDNDSESFGPAKFVGFDDMSFAKYEEAVNGRHTGAPFDGFATRHAIESALDAPFSPDEQLRSKLEGWGSSLLGSGAFKGVDQTKWTFVPLNVQRHYWALVANPQIYDIEAAVSELYEDDWTVSDSNVRAGDRVAIWKAKGRTGHRGIVALGEVLTDPAPRTPLPASRKFHLDETSISPQERRVVLRYVVPPNAPLWLEDDQSGLLGMLSVARATGGTVFKISPERWQKLVVLLGGWRSGKNSTSDVAVEAAVAARAKNQGFQMDSAVRQALEEHAMKRAEAHFVSLFDSVKRRGKPYDLCCTKEASVLYVEVKGTQTDGAEILLTPNEVGFAKKHRGEMALFLVYNIAVAKEDGKIVTSGGSTHIDLNWVIDDAGLSPLGYSYSLSGKQ
ncbi:MAG: EVE domain-containing protein [Terriglobales bacterium]